jgi:serine/threonine protein phosphatase PrpC
MMLKGKLEVVEVTDVGLVREHNEDCTGSDVNLGIAVLADGMGGLNAGEVASSMSVHVLMDELSKFVAGASTHAATGPSVKEEKKLNGSPRQRQDLKSRMGLQSRAIKAVVERANSAVFHVSQTKPECRGMGTTIVALLFHDNQVSIAHIGDSRTYRFRDEQLSQITKDHSFVQELIDQGLYTKDEARLSPQKNVVTRALGIAPTVEVEVHEHAVKEGDLYLVCSDGLTDLVLDENIETSVRQFGKDLKGLADYLVSLANASGGRDNISIILVKVLKPFPAGSSLFERIVGWFE